MSRFLFTSDIHLSQKPQDEYRWSIFPWLAMNAKNRNVDAVFILGDLTEEKDHHSNVFINRVVASLRELSSSVELFLIKGNHDYHSDPKEPLLRFFEGFHTKPKRIDEFDESIWLLPHSRRPLKDWESLELKVDLVCCHQTFDGALAETGVALHSSLFASQVPAKVVVSGDVHVPQRLAQVRYCGAPHPVRFGDNFEPRVLFWDDGSLRSIPRITIRKVVAEVESIDELLDKDYSEGDQVKVRVALPRSRFSDWAKVREEVRAVADSKKWVLCGTELTEKVTEGSSKLPLRGRPTGADNKELFKRFCESNKVDADTAAIGKELLSW